jgi:hypothetical protein
MFVKKSIKSTTRKRSKMLLPKPVTDGMAKIISSRASITLPQYTQ